MASSAAAKAVKVETLHEAHPRVRAADWRSPLVARLLPDGRYIEGSQAVVASFRDDAGKVSEARLILTWTGLEADYSQCINTYQDPVLTEYAALGVACILCYERALEITEVTRRGDKADYWLGDRESLLEVAGTVGGDLGRLCDRKASEQLLPNPFERDGYVCVVRFGEPEARLWFFPQPRA